MIPTSMLSAAHLDDAELVAASLAGNRNAFGEIVARYQALICSLAYSATGSVRQSEDLAQETFVNAWQNLAQLRETAKLRSWLCGIVRHRISRTLDRNRREPSHAAEPLDAAHESAALEALPSEEAITREEQTILWRSLEQIPETYREPLILFYRENQSIERVAAELELSEDAVKQRLSRGRKLLQDQVATFVEGALRQTTPTRVFTLSVLEALPALAIPASVLTAGMTAARGMAAAKTAASVPFAAVLVGPVVGILSGWLGYKVNVANAESARERQFLKKSFRLIWGMAGLFLVVISALVFGIIARPVTHSLLGAVAFTGFIAVYCVSLAGLILWTSRTQSRIRREEAARLAPGVSRPAKRWTAQPFEYRSRATLLGLPLIHVRMECTANGKILPAVGWIAVGNIAYGALFAFGGIAVGAISTGGVAVGLVAIGGVALGVLSFAGMAFGVWAVGGGAVGYMATGGSAFAWLAADGGAAVAHDFALGGAAFAQHANDAAAKAFAEQSTFLRFAGWLSKHATMLIWLPMALVVWQLIALRRPPSPANATREPGCHA